MNENMPERRTPVHPAVHVNVNCPIVVFVTACTDKRKQILCRPEAHRLLVQAWHGAASWRVGRYVVMPDHLHFFCGPADLVEAPPLTRWVRYWKSLVSRAWPWLQEQPIWQKSFWDRQLRTGENYAAKWEYVRGNPVRKGLVANAGDWPYQGELSSLPWVQ